MREVGKVYIAFTCEDMESRKDYDFLVFGAEESVTEPGMKEVVRCIERIWEGKMGWAAVWMRSEEVKIVGMREDVSCDGRESYVVEVYSRDENQIRGLVNRTKVVINLLEPGHGGELILETCARRRVHCVTPLYRTPWLAKMIGKYHNIAKETGTFIIVGLGSETAPQDLLSLISTRELREKLKLDTMEVLYAQPKSSQHSKHDKYQNNMDQWILSPVLGRSLPDGTNILGSRKDSTLGHLSSSKKHYAQAIVYRSWGLLDRGTGTVYGAKFHFNEFVETSHSSDSLSRKQMGKNGHRPQEHLTSANRISMRAVAVADQEGPFPDRALAELTCVGTREALTAILLVEGATTILHDHDLIKKLEGGILTPALLGIPFIERLRGAELEIESALI